MRKIVLASQSPRRRELMMQAGYEFEVIPSTVEEQITKEQPWEVVEELSLQKAQDVYGKVAENEDAPFLVIGADTVVSVDGKILGKPKTEVEAFEMLSLLQGRAHQVYTGVSLVWNDVESDDKKKLKKYTFYACTEVTFYPMSEEEIKGYIATGDCMDKAGAYGIQGKCAVYIEKIDGDYNNVVGLPIGRLYQEIMKVVK